MQQRFVFIWLKYLKTDWFSIHKPELSGKAFVLATPQRGRMAITAVNREAMTQGIKVGMVVADARAICPTLQVLDDRPNLSEKLLKSLGEGCLRYTPVVAIDSPDGLVLDISGCAHLWGGESTYLKAIKMSFKKQGYHTRMAMADTIGAAWAIAHFGWENAIIPPGEQNTALLRLPLSALRLSSDLLILLQKLGLHKIADIIHFPSASLRRRFGNEIGIRLDQALGHALENVQAIQPIQPYQERLPCLEPIINVRGIEIALKKLLDGLCDRLEREEKGLRTACFMGYRVDGKIEKIEIETSAASRHSQHLFKLFELKIATMEPALGIELFTLEAKKVEHLVAEQEVLWIERAGVGHVEVAELLDKIKTKWGDHCVKRYIPEAHYWPERSFKTTSSLQEMPGMEWSLIRPRPIRILTKPEKIEVTAPVPDYPPMLFRYRGKVHTVKKADGPERIAHEWWLEDNEHRDYYCVEDAEGQRYWLFRVGHYNEGKLNIWYLHGFFA